MFKDLQKGFPIHVLDKTEGTKYFCGTIVFVGKPRYEDGPMDMSRPIYDRVIDLTVEYGGKNKTFVVPETSNVQGTSSYTLACSTESIINELNASIKSSTDIIESVPRHKENISQCKEILKSVDKNYAKELQTTERIERIEKALEKLTSKLIKDKDL